MARLKIDYGIDLGTTNSAIARMENGESVIKSKGTNSDTTPSCVYFSRNRRGDCSISVGTQAKARIDADAIMALARGTTPKTFGYIEFKREMGNDKKYSNENMPKDFFTPEELSAEVLKTLKSYINDESVDSVVITVPAKFTAIQNEATMRAAKLAGFKKCELLQEPIAAAMAYGLSTDQKDGIWLVFDFGGGTFDAALLRIEDGISKVFGTEGDQFLGGKNLDADVVNKILIPKLKEDYDLTSFENTEWKKLALLDALKGPAEEIRIALSFDDSTDYSTYDRNLNLGNDDNGNEIDLEITVTKEDLFEALKDDYQRAVDYCKKLLKDKGLTGSSITSLILVGGPTYSPIIREMLKEQITPNVDTSVNPMTAVARGAALYASSIDRTIDKGELEKIMKEETVILDLGYDASSVEKSQWVSISVDKEKNANPPSSIIIEFVRNDGAFQSDKFSVDTNGTVVEVYLLQNKPSIFKINGYDKNGNKIKVFPSDFTILPGGIPTASLAYNIGISVWNATKERGLFRIAKGLEKDKPMKGAVGVLNKLHSRQQLRPGVSEDRLIIPVYQSETAEPMTAALFEYVTDVVLTGDDDFDVLLPEGAQMDITIHAESLGEWKMEVYFPEQDVTIVKNFDLGHRWSDEEALSWVRTELQGGKKSIKKLLNEGIDTTLLQKELDKVDEELKTAAQPKQVLQHLKEVLRDIEDVDSRTEWARLEKEIRDGFSKLERAQDDFGNEKTGIIVEQLRSQADTIICSKDVISGRGLLEQISALFFELARVQHYMAWVYDWSKRFNMIPWKDKVYAKQLINQAVSIINDQPSVEKLHPIIVALVELDPTSTGKDPDDDGPDVED